MFIALKNGLANTSNNTKCAVLYHQKYDIQPTLANLQPHESSQELCYYPFTANLDRCI